MPRLECRIGKIVEGCGGSKNRAWIFRKTLRWSVCSLGERVETCDKAESEHKL